MSEHDPRMLTADDLVIGEAVALDLPPAGLALRIVSGGIDLLVTAVVLVTGLSLLLTAAMGQDEAVDEAALTLALILVFLVVPTAVETLSHGRSLGKLACGLRTVRDDAGPITAQHAFVRALIGVVEIYGLVGVPAFFSALISARGKRLGDYAAGTYVVRDRMPLRLPPPVVMPTGLTTWALEADVAPLPTGLALAVRQYLSRLPTLDPASRAAIGADLADRVARHVAPPAPAGTPPGDYLAAVTVVRRERDRARLAREDALRRRLLRS